MIITFSLAAINIVIFILMVCFGAGFFEPATESILNWGGISAETLLHGNQWWRLFTSMFVHIGIIHLIMNLYILFDIGSHLEPVIGKARFLAVYLATGVFGNLMSQAYHLNSYVVEAGASGAIFGIIGVFFALLTTRFFPSEIREPLWKKVSLLICANIIYGMQSANIGMAAHVGGLLSGFILGYVLYPSLIFSQFKRKLQMATIFVIAISTTLLASGLLKSIKMTDSFQFDKMVSEFKMLEKTINDITGRAPTSTPEVLLFLDNELLPAWNKAILIANKMNQLNLSGFKAEIREYVVAWINLHQEKYSLVLQGIREDTEAYMHKVRSIDEKISKLSIENRKSSM